MQRVNESKRRTIVVTGASSGIGKATVEYFAQNGWRVVATMRNPDRAPAFDAPQEAITLASLDVTKPETIRETIAKTEAEFGGVDVLVNNAGYGLVGPFEAITEDEIRRQFDTNVFGLMAVTRAALPGMRARRGGTIINVASMGGRLTFPYYSVYHATKWAVDGFSESLSYELKPHGIAVKLIEPGPIKTEFYGRSEATPESSALGSYKAHFERVYANMRESGTGGADPAVVAKAIWDAATDGSGRLRYTPNATMILAARWLLGARLYMRGIRRVLEA